MTNNQEDTQFEYILSLIHDAKSRVYQNVNHTQIMLYWQIGGYVFERLSKAEWGTKTVQYLADYLQKKDPLLTNFTKRGLYRMQQFFITYPEKEFVSAMPTQISWTHHLEILSSTKSPERTILSKFVSGRPVGCSRNKLVFPRNWRTSICSLIKTPQGA